MIGNIIEINGALIINDSSEDIIDKYDYGIEPIQIKQKKDKNNNNKKHWEKFNKNWRRK